MFDKLKSALSKTSKKISACVSHVFTKENSIEKIKEEIECALISADLGVNITSQIIEKIKISHTKEEIMSLLRSEIGTKITPFLGDDSERILRDNLPYVIMMIGVNGTGKTTSAAKLAYYYKSKGFKVRLVAADTFRAAATEQLQTWATRIGVNITKGELNADSAAVSYKGIEDAMMHQDEVVIIDTAGRIHMRDDLMMELQKISRVIKKVCEKAPHEIMLVMDVTIGQSSLSQAKGFIDKVGVTSLLAAKLDGTAKGGALVQISHDFKLPIKFIGIGENVEDLEKFDTENFLDSFVPNN